MLKLKYNIFTIVTVVLLLLTAIPFFLLGNTVTVFFAATSVYLGCFFYYVNRYPIKLTKYKFRIFIVTVILFIYLSLPFRQYDSFVFVNVWMLIFLTFLYIRDEDLLKIIRCLFDVMFLICLGALGILLLKIIGIDVPKYEYHTGASDWKKSIYYIYPGTAELIYQNYDIFGRSLFRVSGIFSEPGHFGVVCASVLYMNPALFSKKKRMVILITGLLSLSMGFYALLITYYLLSTRLSVKQYLYLAITIILVVVAVSFLPEEFIFRFFGNKIGSDADILDARTSLVFSEFYDDLVYTSTWIFGAGSDVLTIFNVTSSDYRAFIVKFGVIGLILFAIWFFCLKRTNDKFKPFLYALCFFVIVFVHRSWLVGYLIFFFMNYAIIYSYNINNKFKN